MRALATIAKFDNLAILAFPEADLGTPNPEKIAGGAKMTVEFRYGKPIFSNPYAECYVRPNMLRPDLTVHLMDAFASKDERYKLIAVSVTKERDIRFEFADTQVNSSKVGSHEAIAVWMREAENWPYPIIHVNVANPDSFLERYELCAEDNNLDITVYENYKEVESCTVYRENEKDPNSDFLVRHTSYTRRSH